LSTRLLTPVFRSARTAQARVQAALPAARPAVPPRGQQCRREDRERVESGGRYYYQLAPAFPPSNPGSWIQMTW
jgi:septal ring-binding cell division protein DamX